MIKMDPECSVTEENEMKWSLAGKKHAHYAFLNDTEQIAKQDKYSHAIYIDLYI